MMARATPFRPRIFARVEKVKANFASAPAVVLDRLRHDLDQRASQNPQPRG
jgi:hypothetical protein